MEFILRKGSNMKKRILCLALVMVMIFTSLPMSAFAADVVAEGTCGDNLTWTLDSTGTLTISGTGAMTDYNNDSNAPWYSSRSSIKSVTIGNSVTSIGGSAFNDCTGLTSVTIPDSVTTIGESAFSCCNNLTSVTIGNSVTSIGISAFWGCSSLTSVTIPDSVTTIGGSAFKYCSSLTSINVDNNNEYYSSSGGVLFDKNQTILIWYPAGKTESNYTIPDSVTYIGMDAFYQCNNLTSVTIPNSVTTIGESAFSYCSSLTSVTIGNSVTSIGGSAFNGCISLASVTIPDSVTTIGDSAFYYCSSLTSVTIPDSVTTIGDSAFNYCRSLTNVTIPDSVTSIGDFAFNYCSSLTSVTIGNSVTSIGGNAFNYCTGLTEINYNAKAVTDLTSSSYVFTEAGTAGSGIKVTFGDGVEKIPAYLFYTYYGGRPNISNVSIGSNVTSIGDCAFCNCDGLTSVTIPDSVISIGKGAFEYCSSLTSVTIGNSVTSIGDSAFYNCTGLTEINYNAKAVTDLTSSSNVFYKAGTAGSGIKVTFGDGVEKIPAFLFEDCSSLTSINVDNNNEYYSSSGGVLFDKNQTILIWYPAGKTESNYTIPDSVTTIGERAFRNCSSLTSVTIGNSVTSIGDSAFYNCTGLTEINYNAKAVTDLSSSSNVFYKAGAAGSGIKVTFGDGVKKIPAFLFFTANGRPNISNVSIGSNVTNIGNSAFYDCTGLTSVTIGNSVTSIGNYAFYNCTGLTSVTIPDSVTSIGYHAFYDCTGLTSVTIGNSVTSIGGYAFYNCTGLTSVRIPDSVTSIGGYAFYNCTGLTSVRIPDSVTSIGDSAFYNCTGLTEINYNAKAVTDLSSSSNVFWRAGTAGSGIKVTFGEEVKKVPDYLFSTQYSSYFPKIREIVFVGNTPAIGSKSFNGVTTSAYYPYGNDTWTSEVMKGYGGHITWIPYSDAEATSVVCNGKTSYIVGEELYTSSISVTIERSDGCIEKYNYASGKITLGEYDMSKSGKQSITVTCKDVTAQLNIYIHDLTSETMPANDYPESSHNYEDNLDKTYTYTADGAYSLDVTFSNETEAETNIDYIYVNGTTYTGKELANKTVHINGDTLTVRLVSDGSDGAYGFSIDSIVATYVVYEYTDTVVAPTCTAKGYTIHTCACGESHVDSYVDALGHSFGEWTVTTAPTCTEKGVETRCCSRCDATETRDVDAFGHALVHHDGKAATCTEKGWEAYDTCSRCDYTTYKEIPATGHSYTSVVTEPTCTEQGYTTHTCACGDSYVADYKDALGHSFGEWTVTTAPTCTEKGVETRYCSRCDATETREVDALGHALVHHDGKAAACTEAGWEAYDTCSRCDYTTYKEIPATGHSYTSVVTEPTCTEQGYTTHTCACGDSYVADYKDALGHSFGEWTVTTAPTCTEKGVETRYCSLCDATETRDVDALGHALVHHDGKAATCTEAGWEAYDTCSRCDYTTYKEIPATGHSYTSVVTEPTCTAQGYTTYTCSCGDSYVADYKDALGHSFGEWTVTTAPTCTEKGVETRYCSRCDATETRDVDALGHALVHHDGKAATCTEKGWEAYDTCSRCDYTTYKEIPAAGHDYKDGVCTVCGAKDPNYKPPVNPFVDVKEKDYFYQPVLWAVENGITYGTSKTTFSPNATCTRAQAVTFLWRAMGSPEVSGVKNPFVDVKPSDYYYKAVLWAVKNGITQGIDATHFGPNNTVTRGQTVTFMWRAAGSPQVSGVKNPFVDVKSSDYYCKAVLWAVESGITNGMSATTFGPNSGCTRGQIVTFLYRHLEK